VLLLKPSKRDRIRTRNLSPPESLQVSSIRNLKPDYENAEVESKRYSYANDAERLTRQLNGIHESSLRKATPQNQLREKLANATIMDDDVVEDAVRAATECLSTATSTCSNDVSTTNEVEQTQRTDDGDEFFVIPSPQHRENWSAFDPNNGCSNDFDFRPSESMDEWGDDDRWDFDEDDEWERENKGDKMYFCSPTSVAAGRHFS